MKNNDIDVLDLVQQLKEHFMSTLRQVKDWEHKEAMFMLEKVHGDQIDRIIKRLGGQLGDIKK